MFNKEPVLILDDIKSELDSHTFEVFLSLLELIETQVIFSCIEDIISSKIEDKNIFLIILDLDNALTLNDRAIKTNQRQRHHLILIFLLMLFLYP